MLADNYKKILNLYQQDESWPQAVLLFEDGSSPSLSKSGQILNCSNVLLTLLNKIDDTTSSINVINLFPEKDKSSISINQIRNLKINFKINFNNTKKLVIIYNFELMKAEAQNAFLKLLEEPPSGVHFLIIATKNNGHILKTISSRCYLIEISKPSVNKAYQYFSELGVKINSEDFNKLYNLSMGSLQKIENTLLQDNTQDTQYQNDTSRIAKMIVLKSKDPKSLTELLTEIKTADQLEAIFIAIEVLLKSLLEVDPSRYDNLRIIKKDLTFLKDALINKVPIGIIKAKLSLI
jgi:DNA polymerase III gamma/tau subunit